MQIFQVMGKYQSDRHSKHNFTSHVFHIMLDDSDDCHEAWNLGMHGDDEVQSFYVEEFAA